MKLEISHSTGPSDLARVYVARLEDGACVEFVESVQPPHSRDEKWVLIVSTLKGCPVSCPICDAGGSYKGKLSAEEIIAQVEHMILARYPDGDCPVPKLKVQLARMGDPAFNDAVPAVLEELPERMRLPGLMPCFSTVAPAGRDKLMERVREIKDRLYPDGRFQMQFSVHSTCAVARRRLVPARTWSLEEMAAFGDRFFKAGDRKITLNFAAAEGLPLDPGALAPLFSPERFMVKLTPINPTAASVRSGLTGLIDPARPQRNREIARGFEELGYDTILSIGELEENAIGSNCGMYVGRVSAKDPAVGF